MQQAVATLVVLCELLILESTGSGGTQASVVVACELLELRFHHCGTRAQLPRGMWNSSRPGLNPCSLHWQADSQPVDHQGNPESFLNYGIFCTFLMNT